MKDWFKKRKDTVRFMPVKKNQITYMINTNMMTMDTIIMDMTIMETITVMEDALMDMIITTMETII